MRKKKTTKIYATIKARLLAISIALALGIIIGTISYFLNKEVPTSFAVEYLSAIAQLMQQF